MFEFNLSKDIHYKAEIISIQGYSSYKLIRNVPSLVFLNQNQFSVFFDSSVETKTMSKGQFFLLPPDISCYIRTEGEAEVLCIEIPDMVQLFIQYIGPFGKENGCDMNNLFYPLRPNRLIESFVKNIVAYKKEVREVKVLIGIKATEFFYLLKHCYTEDEVHSFFSPILSVEYSFALFVMENYRCDITARELCDLSNYSASHFERLFRNAFGVSTYKWILERKINNLYLDLLNPTKPIKVIADKYGFGSLSNLGDFCRKHLGHSPTTIRKNNTRE